MLSLRDERLTGRAKATLHSDWLSNSIDSVVDFFYKCLCLPNTAYTDSSSYPYR